MGNGHSTTALSGYGRLTPISPECCHDGGWIGVQDYGYWIAFVGFPEAVSPRSVGGTRLQQSDHRVLPVAPLDDV